MRARISQELREAMKARDAPRVAALRSLAAALDNATAVPMPDRILPNERLEVPRKVLSREDIRAVLMHEIAERRDAAFVLISHAGFEEAAAVTDGSSSRRRYPKSAHMRFSFGSTQPHSITTTSICSRLMLAKAARAQAVYVGSRADFRRMDDFIASHHLHPVIDRVFPLEEYEEALKDLRSGSFVGKIVLRMR